MRIGIDGIAIDETDEFCRDIYYRYDERISVAAAREFITWLRTEGTVDRPCIKHLALGARCVRVEEDRLEEFYRCYGSCDTRRKYMRGMANSARPENHLGTFCAIAYRDPTAETVSNAVRAATNSQVALCYLAYRKGISGIPSRDQFVPEARHKLAEILTIEISRSW